MLKDLEIVSMRIISSLNNEVITEMLSKTSNITILYKSRVERSFFAKTAKGKQSSSCKNNYLKLFGITAHQFLMPVCMGNILKLKM